MQRYSAKLLFQFRVMTDKGPGSRRTCEERIICFRARSARTALTHAKRAGKASNFSYDNSAGNKVFFEFIGVMDLLVLGVEAGPEEVWYDIYDKLLPMERKSRFIPPDSYLTRSLAAGGPGCSPTGAAKATRGARSTATPHKR